MFLMTLGSKAHVSLGLFTGTVLRLDTVLQVILHEGLFKGWAGLYNLFPDEFRGTSGGEREVPAMLVALATTFVGHVLARCASHFSLPPQAAYGP